MEINLFHKEISKLSYEEIKNLAVLVLKRIAQFKEELGTELFNALARLTVGVAVEAVCLRLNPKTKKVEIYLTRRSLNDSAYPGQWHCPGSIMRSGEEIDDIFKRLEKKEFDSGKLLKRQFVSNFNNLKEDRGHFLSLIYLCRLKQNKKISGKWFPVNQLPQKTVVHHAKIVIPLAVKAFLKSK